MKYLEYRNIKSTEISIFLVFKQDSLMVAKLTDNKWRSMHEDFEIKSQDLMEIKADLHHQATKLQDQDLQKIQDQIQALKEEIMLTPAFVLSKQGSLESYQEFIDLGMDNSENSAQWFNYFNKEQKNVIKIKEQLEKILPYHKLFQQVFKGLNPKATRNVFEINTKLFLSELLVKDLPTLPTAGSVDYISKAFFRKEQSSVQDILADLA